MTKEKCCNTRTGQQGIRSEECGTARDGKLNQTYLVHHINLTHGWATGLQTGSVDDLVVNDELTASVVDDNSADGATALTVGLADTVEEVTLGNDLETLADVTGLGHGDDGLVLVDVQDAVGLVDRAEHGLDNDGGRGVVDEARLLLELAGEEVNTQVAVLASLRGDRDTDDLARTTLQDQDVAKADVVAGDGDMLASGLVATALNGTDLTTGGRGCWATVVSNNQLLTGAWA